MDKIVYRYKLYYINYFNIFFFHDVNFKNDSDLIDKTNISYNSILKKKTTKQYVTIVYTTLHKPKIIIENKVPNAELTCNYF